MFVELVVILITLLAASHFFGKRNWNGQLPPGPMQLPIFGNAIQLLRRSKEKPFMMYHDMAKTYGGILFLRVFSLRQVVVEEFSLVKEALGDDIWIDRQFTTVFARRSFGKELGILLVNGGEGWKEMRRFTVRTLREFGFGYQNSMEEKIQEELNYFLDGLKDDISGNDGMIQIKKYFTISVLNILWTMICGCRFPRHDPEIKRLMLLVDRLMHASSLGSSRTSVRFAVPMMRYILARTRRPNARQDEIHNNLHQFFREILVNRRSLGLYNLEQKDFVDAFLFEIDAHMNDNPETNYYTDEQFIIVCMDLFLAGSETTGGTLEFAFLYMILNPEVQTKVQEEIDLIIGRTRAPSLLDRSKMPYTGATLLEIQRMANILPILIRTPTKDTKLGGYFIPRGTMGLFNMYQVHMSEARWREPNKFNPGRFLDDTGCVVNANRILPFGFGKRYCIGDTLAKASLFLFITSILQRYSFYVPTGTSTPEMEPMLGVTLSPKPFLAYVKPRKNNVDEFEV